MSKARDSSVYHLLPTHSKEQRAGKLLGIQPILLILCAVILIRMPVFSSFVIIVIFCIVLALGSCCASRQGVRLDKTPLKVCIQLVSITANGGKRTGNFGNIQAVICLLV